MRSLHLLKNAWTAAHRVRSPRQLARGVSLAELAQKHANPRSYIERRGRRRCGVLGLRLDDFQVHSGCLAVTARLRLEGNPLVFIELA
jgi:hypothetical protein